MKLILMVLLVSSTCLSQELTREVFARYENEKKDNAIAILLWTVVPGGPHFYAENGKGIIYLAATIGAVGIGLAESSAGQSPLIGLVTLAGVRLFDLVLGIEAVDIYNADLRSRLGLTALTGGSRLTIRLEI